MLPELIAALTSVIQDRLNAYNQAVQYWQQEGGKPAVEFKDITWYAVDADEITGPRPGGGTYRARAQYQEADRSIYVARPYVNDMRVLTHEALHAVSGELGHPKMFDKYGLTAPKGSR